MSDDAVVRWGDLLDSPWGCDEEAGRWLMGVAVWRKRSDGLSPDPHLEFVSWEKVLGAVDIPGDSPVYLQTASSMVAVSTALALRLGARWEDIPPTGMTLALRPWGWCLGCDEWEYRVRAKPHDIANESSRVVRRIDGSDDGSVALALAWNAVVRTCRDK